MNGEAGLPAGPDARASMIAAPVAFANTNVITIPRNSLQRLGTLLGFAYEATWTAADDGELDWTTIGEPVAEALSIVRAVLR